MTAQYKLVQWNLHKLVYYAVLAASVVGYITVFLAVGVVAFPAPNEISAPVLLMRATSTLGILLLHVILLIGPLARISPLCAPLLYNRRHLGVTFFLVAFIHSAIAVGYYGGFGVRNPISAVVGGYGSYASISGFPFEALGLLALLVFFVLAATSHDFWLNNLSPRLWKSIHMLVYPAYGLVLLHVVFGVLRSEPSQLYVALLASGSGTVTFVHVIVGVREWRRDARGPRPANDWVDVASFDDIHDGCAIVVCLNGHERIALFRNGDSISAVSNVCAHQGGPLGEGRIVDGCIPCPWHGFQYRPTDGTSPPPYTDKVPTYEVRIVGDRVHINPTPRPAGTPVDPETIPRSRHPEAHHETEHA